MIPTIASALLLTQIGADGSVSEPKEVLRTQGCEHRADMGNELGRLDDLYRGSKATIARTLTEHQLVIVLRDLTAVFTVVEIEDPVAVVAEALAPLRNRWIDGDLAEELVYALPGRVLQREVALSFDGLWDAVFDRREVREDGDDVEYWLKVDAAGFLAAVETNAFDVR